MVILAFARSTPEPSALTRALTCGSSTRFTHTSIFITLATFCSGRSREITSITVTVLTLRESLYYSVPTSYLPFVQPVWQHLSTKAFKASVEADNTPKARLDGPDILSTFASESSDSAFTNVFTVLHKTRVAAKPLAARLKEIKTLPNRGILSQPFQETDLRATDDYLNAPNARQTRNDIGTRYNSNINPGLAATVAGGLLVVIFEATRE